jgi:phosphate transport system substrate-binding protein
LAIAVLAAGSAPAQSVKLQGAGASFPAPLYIKWFKGYGAKHDGVQVDYQSIGSGGGVKAVIDKTVDFGASDAAMSAEEIERVEGGVQLIPMTAGAIVLAYNLPDVEGLKLSRDAYVGIFQGKIKQWNDPKIAAANPGVTLPDTAINVVVRADSSGTSFVFTKHLSTVSEEFAGSVGTNKMPNWTVGTKSKGNEGVSAAIRTTPGSIGYLEFGYAKHTNLQMATLENKAGKFVVPTIEAQQAALAAIEMPENLIAWGSDPLGDESYPIVTYTWMIFYKSYSDAEKAQTIKDLIRYCLTEGQQAAAPLGYIPLPESIAAKGQAALENVH